MTAVSDITGKRFGQLLALERAPSQNRRAMWRCRCDCGVICVAQGHNLRNGHTQSCGCLVGKRLSHGHTRGACPSRTYRVWKGAKRRCFNTNDPTYRRYGARGITMCARWCNNYEAFFADMGEALPGFTLERIDNDGPYEPSNCRWATRVEQGRNKRSNRLIEYEGRKVPAVEVAEHLGIKAGTLRARLYAGWTDAEVIAGVRA